MRRSSLVGLALILVGTVWLLRQVGAVPDVSFWAFFWIGLGIWLLAQTVARRRKGWFWPLGFLTAGIVILLRDLDVIPEEITIWPVIVIAIGFAVLFGAVDEGRDRSRASVPWDRRGEGSDS